MRVIIDPHAGPCPGVKSAINRIEKELKSSSSLVSIGPVIHNDKEISRLEKAGLIVCEQKVIENSSSLTELENSTVFIRSHGISKKFMERLLNKNLEILDGTCGKVKRIHNMVHQYHLDGFQVVITGKADHPEVEGINGYCDNQAVIVKSVQELQKIRMDVKTLLVSQTTFSREEFIRIRDALLPLIRDLTVKDTTCSHINNRHTLLLEFSRSVDVVLLVGGRKSSNTSVLFNICKEQNERSYHIESEADILLEWFKDDDTVGITGSASTPVWQLSAVYNFAKSLKGYINK